MKRSILQTANDSDNRNFVLTVFLAANLLALICEPGSSEGRRLKPRMNALTYGAMAIPFRAHPQAGLPFVSQGSAMPELPEVETVRRGLTPVMRGARIDKVELRRADIRFPFPPSFAKRLTAGASST